MHILPDTRPYPADPVKNPLLAYAAQIACADSGAQVRLARENLHGEIARMLAQKHTLSLSVAMSMAAGTAQYTALMDTLAAVLNAHHPSQTQWFALPVILVAGSSRPLTLDNRTPSAALSACLATYPALRPLGRACWLPQLIHSEDFARIGVQQWFDAAQSPEQAAAFAQALPASPLHVPQEQSVHAVYALGYGDTDLSACLGQALNEAALPLMQVWQQHFAQDGLTLFANPLAANTPLHALADASHTRLRMASDVFAANAIRAIRLQKREVGVVLASRSGSLLFGFNALNDGGAWPQQIFSWPLSPRENIALVQQNFLHLLADCQVEHIALLPAPLPESAALPVYEQAAAFGGIHPFAHPH